MAETKKVTEEKPKNILGKLKEADGNGSISRSQTKACTYDESEEDQADQFGG